MLKIVNLINKNLLEEQKKEVLLTFKIIQFSFLRTLILFIYFLISIFYTLLQEKNLFLVW